MLTLSDFKVLIPFLVAFFISNKPFFLFSKRSHSKKLQDFVFLKKLCFQTVVLFEV